MTNISVINKPYINTDAVEVAESILAMCKTGECVGFVSVLILSNNSYRIRNSSSLSRMQLVGALCLATKYVMDQE